MRIENSVRRLVLQREVEEPRTRPKQGVLLLVGLFLTLTIPGVLLSTGVHGSSSPAGQHWGAGRFGGR
jgi:hypothetical protein